MKHRPTQDKINREKALEERNERDKAFYQDPEKQAQRDQLVMPIDDISDDLVEKREKNERDKKGTYGQDDE
ncbi:hypothetical protein J14TS2_41120 [Bacillus sp. J14TS2]|uniref:hypothetical protein n=1 Tax=unclassified Bacillus (in: firmicutes) TaxID=185979 RepID=UPI001A9583EF|nr:MULTISPECIES: hypothetical protein [unclassified Bacillus (in: firmicutes)]MBO0995558.1 hypothetical protein [Bacillus sp. SD088]GIN73637.1 hypothetical protein J14TS2_41120 [Bacillus sp. J14TS2]